MASVTPEQLTDRIQQVLREYQTEIEQATVECVKSVAKEGTKALKANSPRNKGKYAAGWTSKVEATRVSAAATLYNKKPGLPHLLEFGHVSRNGTGRTFGRVAAYPHIAAVEQTIITEFGRKLEMEITK